MKDTIKVTLLSVAHSVDVNGEEIYRSDGTGKYKTRTELERLLDNYEWKDVTRDLERMEKFRFASSYPSQFRTVKSVEHAKLYIPAVMFNGGLPTLEDRGLPTLEDSPLNWNIRTRADYSRPPDSESISAIADSWNVGEELGRSINQFTSDVVLFFIGASKNRYISVL